MQEYIRSYYDMLKKHTLTAISVNGIKTYISKFDKYFMKLWEYESPISDLQK